LFLLILLLIPKSLLIISDLALLVAFRLVFGLFSLLRLSCLYFGFFFRNLRRLLNLNFWFRLYLMRGLRRRHIAPARPAKVKVKVL
jgi:hypothetical protein